MSSQQFLTTVEQGGFIGVIILMAIVDLVLKAYTSWFAARRGHKVWFVCLLFINTAGILPLIYLLMHRSSAKTVSHK